MTPCTQWTSLDMQKNASKVRLVHHHAQPVFPSISEFFIWGFVAVTSCIVPMNGHPHAPHVRCAMEVLYLGSEIIWEDSLQSKTTHVYQEIICLSRVSRQHMSIFAKAYIWRKLVVSPWKIVKNWLYPSSHISTYITYINLYTLENCDIKLLPIRSKKNRPRRSTSAETSDPWAVAVSQEIWHGKRFVQGGAPFR